MLEKILNKLKKVLIVDDDAVLRKVLSDKLKLEGYRVFEADYGGSALRMVDESHPHVILLDLMMPDVNGQQVLEDLSKSIWGRRAKIIILSNLNDDAELKAKYPLYAYFIKGSTPLETVIKTVGEAIANG